MIFSQGPQRQESLVATPLLASQGAHELDSKEFHTFALAGCQRVTGPGSISQYIKLTSLEFGRGYYDTCFCRRDDKSHLNFVISFRRWFTLSSPTLNTSYAISLGTGWLIYLLGGRAFIGIISHSIVFLFSENARPLLEHARFGRIKRTLDAGFWFIIQRHSDLWVPWSYCICAWCSIASYLGYCENSKR